MEKKKSAWEKFTNTKVIKTLKEYWGIDDWIALGIALVGVLYYWKNGPLPYHPGWHEFYEKIHVELIGIGITVLILGNANQAIRTKQEKRRLILQMGSPDNSFAREAVRQLRARGWLFDGTAKGVDLIVANLEGADLREAHLEGADLIEADLKRANLRFAYLEGALLLGTHMEEANLRFAHLEGADLIEAHLEMADLREVMYDDKTIWTETKYNKDTQWPEGFDPEAAGCILVEDE